MLTALIIFIVVLVVMILQRHHLLNPDYNNWIFLGFCAVALILLINAFAQGGGEPLGLNALREIGKPTEESPIVKYYSDSMKHFIGPVAKAPEPTKQGTWFWWHLFFMWTTLTIICGFFTFRDDLVALIRRITDWWEQREEEFDILPPQEPAPQPVPQPGAPQPQPGAHASVWTRFKERFWSSFSADIISQSIFELFGRLAQQMMTRRR